MRRDSDKINPILNKYFNRACTERELQEVIDLLADSNNIDTINYLKDHWDLTLQSETNDGKSKADQTHLKTSFAEIIRKAGGPKKESLGKKILFGALKVAALVLFLVAIPIAGSYFKSKPQVEFTEKITRNGEKITVKLSDGSVIKMNSASSLSIPNKFGNNKREVKLLGEAFFNVAKDTLRPFVVNVGKFNVAVLGTSFNIKSFDSDEFATVTVVSGKVKVMLSSNRNLVLLPTQTLVINKITESYALLDSGSNNYIGWTKGKLVFNNTTVSEVLHMLERWYNIKTVIQSEKMLGAKVSGEHKNENLYSVMEALKFSTNLNYSISNDTLYIK